MNKYNNPYTEKELQAIRDYYPTKTAQWIKDNHIPSRTIHSIRKKAQLMNVKSIINHGTFKKGRISENKGKIPPPHVMEAMRQGRMNKPKKPYPRFYLHTQLKVWVAEFEDGSRTTRARYEFEKHHRPLKDNEIVMFINGKNDDFTPHNLEAMERQDAFTYNLTRVDSHHLKMANVYITKIERGLK